MLFDAFDLDLEDSLMDDLDVSEDFGDFPFHLHRPDRQRRDDSDDV